MISDIRKINDDFPVLPLLGDYRWKRIQLNFCVRNGNRCTCILWPSSISL